MTYNAETKIASFTQLRTWQKAREFAVKTYEVTRKFPSEEKFGLSSQMQRSATSIPANIAEGFSRNSAKEKVQFYHIALGSLTETLSHSYIAHDLGFLSQDALEYYIEETEVLHKMINGMIKTSQGRMAA
jgi:four helix bundle protein